MYFFPINMSNLQDMHLCTDQVKEYCIIFAVFIWEMKCMYKSLW
jgi:hypothetical protein